MIETTGRFIWKKFRRFKGVKRVSVSRFARHWTSSNIPYSGKIPHLKKCLFVDMPWNVGIVRRPRSKKKRTVCFCGCNPYCTVMQMNAETPTTTSDERMQLAIYIPKPPHLPAYSYYPSEFIQSPETGPHQLSSHPPLRSPLHPPHQPSPSPTPNTRLPQPQISA